MSEKVFWGSLGGILLGWIVLFFLVVWGQIDQYGKVSAQLAKNVSAMKKHSKRTPEELPTDLILNKLTRFNESWKKNVDNAVDFFESREARLKSGMPSQNKNTWLAGYRDAYEALAKDYRASLELEVDEDVPFEKIEIEDNGSASQLEDLLRAERQWLIQQLFISEVIAAGGSVSEFESIDKRKRDDLNEEGDPRMNFDLDQITIQVKMPPSRVTRLIHKALDHSLLNLELNSILVGKDQAALIGDVVFKVDAEGDTIAEPPVMARMVWNVLAWKPTETPAQ